MRSRSRATEDTHSRRWKFEADLQPVRVRADTILTEINTAPLRAVALASFLVDGGYSALGRATPAKDLMAFGSVMHHTPHNIGKHGGVGGRRHNADGKCVRPPDVDRGKLGVGEGGWSAIVQIFTWTFSPTFRPYVYLYL